MNNCITVLKLAGGFLATLINSFYFNVELIKPEQLNKKLQTELQQFEREFSYPFSDQEDFTITHGKEGDYLSFFKTLGTPYFYRIIYKNKIPFIKKSTHKQNL